MSKFIKVLKSQSEPTGQSCPAALWFVYVHNERRKLQLWPPSLRYSPLRSRLNHLIH